MTWASAWSDAVLRASWQGAMVILVLWAVTRAFPRLPPTWRCWAWRVACAKLLLSLACAGAVALPLLPARRELRKSRMLAPVSDGSTSVAPHTASEAPPLIAAAPARAEAVQRATLPTVLFSLWCAGVVFCAARLVQGHARVAAMRRGARPVEDPTILDLCSDLCRRLGVRRPPAILMSAQTHSPLLTGVIRPAIILAPGAPESTVLSMMLAHELAHLKRRDLLWNWLPALVQALFFFHPLAWLACRELRLAQESACDELAVSASGTAPDRYGRMLLDVIESLRTPLRLPRTGAATIIDSRTTVKRRFAAMTYFNTPLKPRRAAAALAVLLATLLVPWRIVAQAPPADRPAPLAGQNPVGREARRDFAAPNVPIPNAQQAPVEQEDLREVVAARGQVTAPEFRLFAPLTGRVAKVAVLLGQRVKKGELLVGFDDFVLKAELEAAHANVELAKAEAQLAAGHDNAPEQRAANAKLRAAEAQVALVQHRYEGANVVAPADGVISELGARVGDPLREGSAVATLVAVDSLSFLANVPAKELGAWRVGQHLTIWVDALDPELFDAQVTFISPTVEPSTGTVRVDARITDGKGKLRPGLTGNATFRLASKGNEGQADPPSSRQER